MIWFKTFVTPTVRQKAKDNVITTIEGKGLKCTTRSVYLRLSTRDLIYEWRIFLQLKGFVSLVSKETRGSMMGCPLSNWKQNVIRVSVRWLNKDISNKSKSFYRNFWNLKILPKSLLIPFWKQRHKNWDDVQTTKFFHFPTNVGLGSDTNTTISPSFIRTKYICTFHLLPQVIYLPKSTKV